MPRANRRVRCAHAPLVPEWEDTPYSDGDNMIDIIVYSRYRGEYLPRIDRRHRLRRRVFDVHCRITGAVTLAVTEDMPVSSLASN